MKQPDFTIVTPSFKQLDYLGCCIASVADQEGVTVDHVVQDAGSPGIEEFAKKMAEQLLGKYGGERASNLHTSELLHIRTAHGYTLRIFREKDEGMYDAINRGLEKSHSDLFAWLNSDEQYFSDTLQAVKRSFVHDKSVDVVLGDVVLLNKDYHPAIYRRIMKPYSWHTRLVHLHSLSAATFFKRGTLPNPRVRKAMENYWGRSTS